MLLALAAYAANSTDGSRPSPSYLQQVSGGTGEGEKVTDLRRRRRDLDEGEQIDYDGFSGPITFDENGDPTEATIGIYQYGDDNNYTRIDEADS